MTMDVSATKVARELFGLTLVLISSHLPKRWATIRQAGIIPMPNSSRFQTLSGSSLNSKPSIVTPIACRIQRPSGHSQVLAFYSSSTQSVHLIYFSARFLVRACSSGCRFSMENYLEPSQKLFVTQFFALSVVVLLCRVEVRHPAHDCL